MHDGEPQGVRVFDARDYAVFNTILRWHASETPTVEIVVQSEPNGVEALVRALSDDGRTAENWTTSITLHCLACSHGRVDFDHPDHDHGTSLDRQAIRVGCSGELGDVDRLTRQWAEANGAIVDSIAVVA